MKVSRIILKNWFNFQSVDVPLTDRIFCIGANASGKSNFLDAFRMMMPLCRAHNRWLFTIRVYFNDEFNLLIEL